MKKNFTLLLIGAFLFFPAVKAEITTTEEEANSRPEIIKSFYAETTLNQNSAVDIKENIIYDFGAAERHGIFRYIPIGYNARGGKYKLRVSKISITDADGAPLTFKISYPQNKLNIRIGDPEKTITGLRAYAINYTVKRAINYFDDYDEFYWNITGNDWPVDSVQTSASVILPAQVPENQLKIACYSGNSGNADPCDSFNYNKQNGQVTSIFFQQGYLYRGQGLTVVVGLPKDILTKPPLYLQIIYVLCDNWTLGIPVLVFIICFYLWWKFGRDPKERGVIIAEYEAPNKLSPGAVGAILNGSAKNKEVVAEIIFLATKGYLKIPRRPAKSWLKKNDYELSQVKAPAEHALTPWQKTLWNGLFQNGKESVLLSNLTKKFYDNYIKMRDQLCDSLKTNNYYTLQPYTIRMGYYVAGLIISIGSLAILGIANAYISLSVLLAGIIIIFFGRVMPQPTKRGAEIMAKIKGLKLYMTVAEKDRIKFHNAPEKNPQHFEELLPYAIALKIEKGWAKQFKNLKMQEPRSEE